MSGMPRGMPAKEFLARANNMRDRRDARIEELEDLLHDIAIMAEGHKTSRLHVDGQNVALANIRNMAALAIGMSAPFRKAERAPETG